MWKCPNCETINDSEFCIICGEAKPTFDSEAVITNSDSIKDTYSAEASVRHRNTAKIIAALCISVTVIALAAFIILQVLYTNALNALNSSEYDKAIEFATKIEFYRDADWVLSEANYRQAQNYIDDNEYEQALNKLNLLSSYKNSDELILKCKYEQANLLIDSAEYDEAIGLLSEINNYQDARDLKQYATAKKHYEDNKLISSLNDFNKIIDFRDTPELVINIKAQIYAKGIDLYHDLVYSESKKYFNSLKSEDYQDVNKYMTLLQAHMALLSDVSKLYELIDFEDTKEILLNDEYILKFLMGKWSDSAGNYLEFYKENANDTTTWCSYSLPNTDGKYYKIENKTHYKGSDETGWKKQWTYQIISKNTISIYDYIDGKIYTLRR